MREKIKKDLDLLASKKDCTRWTNSGKRVVLPRENYYEVLTEQPFVFVREENGHNSRFGYDINSKLYFGINPGSAIALVSSRKSVDSIAGVSLYPYSDASVSVATYVVENDEVVILNRFDPKGRTHINSFTFILNPEEQVLARAIFKDGADCPHFHFNTKSQAENLKNADGANAISISSLIAYLNAIMQESNFSLPILQYNFGMPFLAFRKGEMTYQSQCIDIAQGFVDDASIDDKVGAFFSELINQYKSCSSTSESEEENLGVENIRKIISDFKLIRDVLEQLPGNDVYIQSLSEELLNAISGITEGEGEFRDMARREIFGRENEDV